MNPITCKASYKHMLTCYFNLTQNNVCHVISITWNPFGTTTGQFLHFHKHCYIKIFQNIEEEEKVTLIKIT